MNNNKIEFFIYIVESPSPEDIYSSRTEGFFIAQAASLNKIKCSIKTVTNLNLFTRAINDIPETMSVYQGKIPILHVSAHGNDNGIAFTENDSYLSWKDFYNHIAPVNKALAGKLLLCMSSCNGFHAHKMILHTNNNKMPFFALIGNEGKPSWPETAIAFATFYHHINKGKSLESAIEAAKIASDNSLFRIISTNTLNKAYKNVLQKIKAEAVIKNLSANKNPRGLIGNISIPQ